MWQPRIEPLWIFFQSVYSANHLFLRFSGVIVPPFASLFPFFLHRRRLSSQFNISEFNLDFYDLNYDWDLQFSLITQLLLQILFPNSYCVLVLHKYCKICCQFHRICIINKFQYDFILLISKLNELATVLIIEYS